uniref:Acrosin-binding protein n=1 Tax=Terrapene triunguis TaxID=2587831 RepID=A0A674IEU3_9SAUR
PYPQGMGFLPKVLSSWCSAAHLQDEGPLLTGTPLSEPEYDQFFKPLRAPYRASATCLIRALYGCQNPLIRRLDQYENHGVIPQGKADHGIQKQGDWGLRPSSTGNDQMTDGKESLGAWVYNRDGEEAIC